jgi:DNA invertase Pin-like site-specific DNA recombinase
VEPLAATRVSGSKDSRPQLATLMRDARVRSLDAVIVARFDRIARSTRHSILALDEFQA